MVTGVQTCALDLSGKVLSQALCFVMVLSLCCWVIWRFIRHDMHGFPLFVRDFNTADRAARAAVPKGNQHVAIGHDLPVADNARTPA